MYISTSRLFRTMAAAIAIILAAAGTAGAYTIKASPGKDTGLIWLSFFYPVDCKPFTPKVTIIVKPKYGTVRVARGKRDTRKGITGGFFSNRCIGKGRPTVDYIYRSRAGFRGRDTVTLRVIQPERVQYYRFTIIVK